MYEITDDVILKVEKILAKGEKNRNKILDLIIGNDQQLKTILKMYKMQKNEFDIVIETKLPMQLVRNSLNYIDELNRLIDKKTNNISSQKFYKKKIQNKKTKKGVTLDEKIKECRKNEINEKKDARKKLNTFFYNYQKAKLENKLNKKSLRKNIEQLKELIDLLGYMPSDMLYLASIFNDLGEFEKSFKILNDLNENKLSTVEMKNYKRVRNQSIILRNKKLIRLLYDDGLSIEKIMKECEKQISEYRVPFLDMDFIKQIITEYKNENKTKKELADKKEDDEWEL